MLVAERQGIKESSNGVITFLIIMSSDYLLVCSTPVDIMEENLLRLFPYKVMQ